MVLKKGESIHVINRRAFETDLRRHFLGVVQEIEGSIVRLVGNAIVYDSTKNIFVQREDQRTRILDIGSAGYIVNVISESVNIKELKYKYDNNNRLVLTDDKAFTMDINEFGLNR
ncbi:MAG: hypothetical protein DWQ47_13100 [Acidobacteria bacterium]|nr:MAG: hypothetical protein DWQ32_00500 [Acidobacteriota bacterium]REK02982.1 MAG: hypothetical protein DWQ38_11635 [Acidobacteriota bacterium]REK13214.1 MAG: hypothetical protein DWQ43_06190 [Acidobacteriota bacterium]REK41208.1 MAG: hypothetical protein DWQ47_13100 [Acidobacteriota bacterium]